MGLMLSMDWMDSVLAIQPKLWCAVTSQIPTDSTPNNKLWYSSQGGLEYIVVEVIDTVAGYTRAEVKDSKTITRNNIMNAIRKDPDLQYFLEM